jgi:hypothetical protein
MASSTSGSLHATRRKFGLPRCEDSLWFQLQTRFAGCFSGSLDRDWSGCFGGIINKSTKHIAFDEKVAATLIAYMDTTGKASTKEDREAIVKLFATRHPDLMKNSVDDRSKVLHSIHKQTGSVFFVSRAHETNTKRKRTRPRREPRPTSTSSSST